MNCEEIKELSSDYLDRRLTPDRESVLEAHLESCSVCREEIETLRANIVLAGSLDRVETSADFLAQVHRKIEGAAWRKRLWGRLFEPPVIKVPLHITALTLLAIFAFQMFYRSPELSPERGTSILPESQRLPQDLLQEKVLPKAGTAQERRRENALETGKRDEESYRLVEPQAPTNVEAELSRGGTSEASKKPEEALASTPQPAVIELTAMDVSRYAERIKVLLEGRGGRILGLESSPGSDLFMTVELPQSRQAEFLAAARKEADVEAGEAPRPVIEQAREKALARKDLAESLRKLRAELSRSEKAAPLMDEERKGAESTVRLQLHILPKK